jgi:sarcosine oxidase, subunit beta
MGNRQVAKPWSAVRLRQAAAHVAFVQAGWRPHTRKRPALIGMICPGRHGLSKDQTMQRFSGLSLLRRGLSGQLGWQPQWRRAEPKAAYDALIVGGGGHGLGAAYYLAREHGLTNVAVIEKGWIGGGNTGRNTTIIRSNYLRDESAALYDHALKMWESLSQQLNYNVMFSPRGVMMLAHTVHDVQVFKRHVHANHANGVDNEWLTPQEARAICPLLQTDDIRYPVLGAAFQRRGGTARHDAVAWGYARAADALGVDIIENCEVIGIRRDARGAVQAVETTRGLIQARRIGISAAGHSSVILKMAGVPLPLESYPLQALVSEPVKPIFPCVVMSNTIHAYISQSDKGELVIGAGTDAYTSYTQRGGLHIPSHALEAVCELFPMFRRMRMLRNWGGIVDVSPDRSPIIGKTPVPGLYVNCGWGTGGFKATPGSAHLFAWTIAHDQPHPINAPFTIERFREGRLIDEAAAAAVAH